MPRPNRTAERRRELIPVIARAFTELGYRRSTTAELARRCEVQENILYRLWPDKRAMFIAAIEHMAFDESLRADLSRRGPLRVRERFGWERVARETLAVHAEAAAVAAHA